MNYLTKSKICQLGIKNQQLISKCIDKGLISTAKNLVGVDSYLSQLLSLKSDTNFYYIWRTKEDVKVRPTHAENNGKIFSWENPPETGNPGEEFGCRCRAEPVKLEINAEQKLLTGIADSIPKWTIQGFLNHYFSNNPDDLTLYQVGYLSDIIKFYAYEVEGGVYKKVNEQIVQAGLAIENGSFDYSFARTYDFSDVCFIFGDSTVKGEFQGNIKKDNNSFTISGIIAYKFYDEFADPAQIIELISTFGINRQDVPEWVGGAADILGSIYKITDYWQTEFKGIIRIK